MPLMLQTTLTRQPQARRERLEIKYTDAIAEEDEARCVLSRLDATATTALQLASP